MSKGNLFLGYARGKVGDVVFSHQYGEQVTRARNRSPKNPKSPLQTLQRVCMNSVSKAYSYFKDICDHSFEGKLQGTPCQSEFARLNVEHLRNKLAYQIAFPFDEVMRDCDAFNFNRKGDTVPVANEWIVSSGSLRPLHTSIVSYVNGMFGLIAPYKQLSTSSTYADIVEALGAQRGDQLTFLVATISTSSSNPYLRTLITGFTYARIILEPADGDMSLPFFSGSDTTWAVNAPNPSNEGTIIFSGVIGNVINVTSINHIVKQGDEALAELFPALATVILSRQVGGTWLRSSQSLNWTRQATSIPDEDEFGLAYLSYQDSVGSSLYLNQAE